MASTSVPGVHSWGNQGYASLPGAMDYLHATEEVCGRLFYWAAGLLVWRTTRGRECAFPPSSPV